jgi:aryl-alcohol dehydrogenase-like predicted oxidoreductase
MPDRLAAADFDRIEAVEAFAEERGLSMLQVAIGGLAATGPVASVIAGATSVDQIRANAAAGEWAPTAEELETLRTITA